MRAGPKAAVTAADPLLRILLDSAAVYIEADLRLADRVEDDADDLATSLAPTAHGAPAEAAAAAGEFPETEVG